MTESNRIVITGIGAISSIGKNPSEIWAALISKKTNVVLKKCYVDGHLWEEFPVHKLVSFSISEFVKDSSVIKWIMDWKDGNRDIDFELFATVVSQALENSGVDPYASKKDTGLFLVHENQGLENLVNSVVDSAYDVVKKYLDDGKALNKLEIFKEVNSKCHKLGYDTQSFMHLFFIAKIFNIHGYSLFSNNACASGLFAIEAAAQQIKNGRLSTAVVAGVDYPDYIYKYLWFKNLNIYANDGLIKPFAVNRNGFVFGEGGGALVLERYDKAMKRKAKIYGEYLGGCFSLESAKVSLPNVSSNLYADTISQALKFCGVSPKGIDLINPHGIGESVTDLHEARSISWALKNKSEPFITAFKPYVGHNLGSSALLELCILMMCLDNQYIPPILNCEQVDPRIRLNLVREGISKKITTALKLSCGFAGYNGAIVLRSALN